MKKGVILLYLFFQILIASAQQDQQYSHNMFNHVTTNPAYAGNGADICATLITRQSYVGLPGAPTTNNFSIHAAIKPFGIKSGVGLTIVDDRLGADKNMNIKGAYAYKRSLFSGQLSLGIDVGIMSKAIDGTWTTPGGGTGSEDNAIPVEAVDKLAVDFGFGVFYNDDKFYAGISSTHLTEPTIKFEGSSDIGVKRHYYITGGYAFNGVTSSIDIIPSIFIKSDGVSSSFNLNTNFVYNKKFWGGVSYRVNDGFVGLAGIELPNGLRISYAYDLTLSKLRTISNGTHEVLLNYCFTISRDKSPQKYRSVRFL